MKNYKIAIPMFVLSVALLLLIIAACIYIVRHHDVSQSKYARSESDVYASIDDTPVPVEPSEYYQAMAPEGAEYVLQDNKLGSRFNTISRKHDYADIDEFPALTPEPTMIQIHVDGHGRLTKVKCVPLATDGKHRLDRIGRSEVQYKLERLPKGQEGPKNRVFRSIDTDFKIGIELLYEVFCCRKQFEHKWMYQGAKFNFTTDQVFNGTISGISDNTRNDTSACRAMASRALAQFLQGDPVSWKRLLKSKYAHDQELVKYVREMSCVAQETCFMVHVNDDDVIDDIKMCEANDPMHTDAQGGKCYLVDDISLSRSTMRSDVRHKGVAAGVALLKCGEHGGACKLHVGPDTIKCVGFTDKCRANIAQQELLESFKNAHRDNWRSDIEQEHFDLSQWVDAFTRTQASRHATSSANPPPVSNAPRPTVPRVPRRSQISLRSEISPPFLNESQMLPSNDRLRASSIMTDEDGYLQVSCATKDTDGTALSDSSVFPNLSATDTTSIPVFPKSAENDDYVEMK